MLEGFLQIEEDLRRKGQELAVAWRRGKAAYVLDSLCAETPLRAAALASLIQDLLGRWDPVEKRWPVGFWRALVLRSEGWLTAEEFEELGTEYRRRFGVSPPKIRPPRGRSRNQSDLKEFVEHQAGRIREALAQDEPIPRQPVGASQPTEFLRAERGAR